MSKMHVPFAEPRSLVVRMVRVAAFIAPLVAALASSSLAHAADEDSEAPTAEEATEKQDTDSAKASASSSTGGSTAPGAPFVGPASGTHLIFLEAGFRQDYGMFSRRDVVGENIVARNDDYEEFSSMFHVGFLEKVADRVRLGGAFGYGGNYAAGNDLLGQLMTLDMRVEYGIPLTPKWGLVGAPRFGVSMLIPGGILADRINSNQLAGYDTWGGPRFGFLIGGDIGARYGFTDWFSVRATIGYAWFIMLLLNTHASDGEISASQSWTAHASRLSGNLGLEVTF